MHTKELIESIVINEVKGLCVTCMHAETCVYYKTATKGIIQCELYTLEVESVLNINTARGLCKTCDHALHCKLPGKNEGVWRCNEFL